MTSQSHLQSIWRFNKMIFRVRSQIRKPNLVDWKQGGLCQARDHQYLPSCRSFSNYGNESSGVRNLSPENRREMKETSEITNKSHFGVLPSNTLNSQDTMGTGDEEEEVTVTKAEKRKKKPISEMLKVIRDKKLLERYQQTSKKRKGKTSSTVLPVIAPGRGYKDQLLEYISRHDETWEDSNFDDCQFAVSKSGKVMMFPLKNVDISSQNITETSSEDTKMPSVTRILHVTRPLKQALSLLKWENKMIAELGEDGFKQMKQEMFAQGHSIHRTFEKYLQGTFKADLDLSPETVGFWESSSEVIPRIKLPSGFEIKVKHPALSYSGYTDCIAEVDGKLSLIEWKTSRKPKLDLKYSEDYALQAVAYLGALNFDPAHNFQVEQVVIVVVYKDGMKATVHILDEEACNHYWIKWLERLLEYQEIADMKKAYVKRKIIAWSKTKAAEKEEEEESL